MFNTVLAYLKRPTTIVGIITAIMFQLIFSLVWMSGYSKVNDNVGKFHIAFVNQDTEWEQEKTDSIAKSLPFTIVSMGTPQEARDALEKREIQMSVTIPKNFTKEMKNGNAVLQYAINESNPAMVKSMMESVVQKLTEGINRAAATQGTSIALENLHVSKDQAEQMAPRLVQPISSKVDSLHPVENLSMQMAPLMLILASYVGSMIMCLNIQISAMSLIGAMGKWKQFGARCIINAGSSFVISAVGTIFIFLLGDQIAGSFISVWLFLSLMIFAFLSLNQIALLLFGTQGMLVNMTLFSLQLLTSGAMVPRQLFSGFFEGISNWLPATYGVEGLMDLLFGGVDISQDVWYLLIASGLALLAGVFVVALKNVIALKKKKSVAQVA